MGAAISTANAACCSSISVIGSDKNSSPMDCFSPTAFFCSSEIRIRNCCAFGSVGSNVSNSCLKESIAFSDWLRSLITFLVVESVAESDLASLSAERLMSCSAFSSAERNSTPFNPPPITPPATAPIVATCGTFWKVGTSLPSLCRAMFCEICSAAS